MNDGRDYVYAAAVPIDLLTNATSSEIRVFGALSSFAGSKHSCYPGLDKISERSGVHRSHISQALRSLEQKGWIETTRRGKCLTNFYRVWRPSKKKLPQPNATQEPPHEERAQSSDDAPSPVHQPCQSDCAGVDDSARGECSESAKVSSLNLHSELAESANSNSKNNNEKEAAEKGDDAAPSASSSDPDSEGTRERAQLSDAQFESAIQKIAIPETLRPQYQRYRQIIRSEQLIERFGVPRAAGILHDFANEAGLMEDFDPVKGPGLFRTKMRNGQYTMSDRDFDQDDRRMELSAFERYLPECFDELLADKSRWRCVPTLSIATKAAAAVHFAARGYEEIKESNPQNFWQIELFVHNAWRELDEGKKEIVREFARSKGVEDFDSAFEQVVEEMKD